MSENIENWLEERARLGTGTKAQEVIDYINHLKEVNYKMHSQVAGYLHGEDWDHWKEFNKDKFTI